MIEIGDLTYQIKTSGKTEEINSSLVLIIFQSNPNFSPEIAKSLWNISISMSRNPYLNSYVYKRKKVAQKKYIYYIFL